MDVKFNNIKEEPEDQRAAYIQSPAQSVLYEDTSIEQVFPKGEPADELKAEFESSTQVVLTEELKAEFESSTQVSLTEELKAEFESSTQVVLKVELVEQLTSEFEPSTQVFLKGEPAEELKAEFESSTQVSLKEELAEAKFQTHIIIKKESVVVKEEPNQDLVSNNTSKCDDSSR
jgi:hypothetical protein